MAWTSPRTWVAAEKPPASTLNIHIRDNLKAIGDAWTAYTPTWTAASVNPAIGNGTITGAYIAAGKLIIGRIKLTLGSTSTVGTGAYRWSLPVTASTSVDDTAAFGLYFDVSGVTYSGTCALITTTTFGMWQGGGGPFTAASPVTPANGDKYVFQFTYEAA